MINQNIGFKYKESSLIVQALKALGQSHTDDKAKERLSTFLSSKQCDKILKDTQTSTAWIDETIKEIYQKMNEDV